MTLLSHLRRLWSLKTLDAFLLFVLSDILLEDKPKFKHGGVISVVYACVFLNDLDSILGLICIILQFMPLFLRSHLVSAGSGFNCRVTHIELSVRRKYRRWGQTKSRMLAKEAQYRPKTVDPKHASRSKAKHKTTCQEGGEQAGQRPPRVAHGECHDRGRRKSPGHFSFFAAFHFLCDFSSVWVANFPLKKNELGCKRRPNSILSTFHYHLVLVFIRLERKSDRQTLEGFHTRFAIERLKRNF